MNDSERIAHLEAALKRAIALLVAISAMAETNVPIDQAKIDRDIAELYAALLP